MNENQTGGVLTKRIGDLTQLIRDSKARTKKLLVTGLAALAIPTGWLGYNYVTAPKAVAAAEMAAHAGAKVERTFVVGSSLKSKNHALLNEGEFPKHTSTVRITPDHPLFAAIPTGKDTVKGRTITAAGTAGSYKDKPQLQVGAKDRAELK